MKFEQFFLVGGAGFIGSHFIDVLLNNKNIKKITVFDNFSSGKQWHLKHNMHDPRLAIIEADVKDLDVLKESMKGHDIVMHFASNSDISQAMNNPTIDFTDGICLTYNVLEAARNARVQRMIYFSGSGVYGDMGYKECYEEQGALYPVSPYGASKLAGEAFISSYCHMFGLSACIFRFGNVVGARQTHGVGYDFIKKLLTCSDELEILGNGNQSKSYVFIDDVIQAVLLANEKLQTSFEVYNVATGDYISVKEIAEIVVDCMNLNNKVRFRYTGGNGGWRGDVPIIRLNTSKIRALGWECHNNSFNSIRKSVLAMLANYHKGLLFSRLTEQIND